MSWAGGFVVLDVCQLLNYRISVSGIEAAFISHVAPSVLLVVLMFTIVALVCKLGHWRAGRAAAGLAVVTAYLLAAAIVGFQGLSLALAWRYDSIEGTLIHSTIWAPGFSDLRFKQVRPNLARAALVDLLGPPIRSFRVADEEVLAYTDIGHYRAVEQKAFHQRWIVLRRGRVARVIRRFVTTEDDPLG